MIYDFENGCFKFRFILDGDQERERDGERGKGWGARYDPKGR